MSNNSIRINAYASPSHPDFLPLMVEGNHFLLVRSTNGKQGASHFPSFSFLICFPSSLAKSCAARSKILSPESMFTVYKSLHEFLEVLKKEEMSVELQKLDSPRDPLVFVTSKKWTRSVKNSFLLPVNAGFLDDHRVINCVWGRSSPSERFQLARF